MIAHCWRCAGTRTEHQSGETQSNLTGEATVFLMINGVKVTFPREIKLLRPHLLVILLGKEAGLSVDAPLQNDGGAFRLV